MNTNNNEQGKVVDALTQDVLQGLREYYPSQIDQYSNELAKVAKEAFPDSGNAQQDYEKMRDSVEKTINSGELDRKVVEASVTKASFTVWVYDHDAAPHHDNDLMKDTFPDANQAAAVARQRVKETNHNTGWAKVIDNSEAGKMGDSGFVVEFKKDKNGRVYESAIRGGYEGRLSVASKKPKSTSPSNGM